MGDEKKKFNFDMAVALKDIKFDYGMTYGILPSPYVVLADDDLMGPDLPQTLKDARDVQAVFENVKLKGSFLPFNVRFEQCIRGPCPVGFDIIIDVEDREDPRQRKLDIRNHYAGSYGPLRDFLLAMRNGVVDIFSHEIDEFFFVRKDRYFDPHDRSKALKPLPPF